MNKLSEQYSLINNKLIIAEFDNSIKNKIKIKRSLIENTLHNSSQKA